MRRERRLAGALLGLVAAGAMSCTDTAGPRRIVGTGGSGLGGESARGGAGGSAAQGGGGGARVGCLESPESLPRPPSGNLPCDLIPPGLVL